MPPMIRPDHRSSLLVLGPLVLLVVVVVAGCSSSDATTRDAEDTTRTAARTVTTETNRAGGASSAGPTAEYLEPTDESVATTIASLGDGPFVMLNLFRLRDEPDFETHPELKPKTPMSSRELFYKYIDHMDGYLDKVGAKRVLLADGGPMLIGPTDEHWDVVQMVEYPSKRSFIELGLLVRPEVADREVMLSDSRIMPLHEQPLDAVTQAG